MQFSNAFTIQMHINNPIHSARWNGAVTIDNLINCEFMCTALYNTNKMKTDLKRRFLLLSCILQLYKMNYIDCVDDGEGGKAVYCSLNKIEIVI